MQSQVPRQFCLCPYKYFRIGAYADPQLSTLMVDVLNGLVRETPGAGLDNERCENRQIVCDAIMDHTPQA